MATDVTSILNFLASLAEGGLAYRTVNTFRSAISAGHIPLEGVPVGEHPLVCRLLRGIRLSLPPELRYSRLWDVNLVLNLFLSWQPNRYLSRKELSAKLAMLLCLISCRRVSDVRALDVTSRVFSPSGVTFTIRRRTKCGSTSVSYPALPDSPKLCVVACLKAYEEMSEEFRPPGERQLLIALRKPHRAVSSPTIARWVRWIMQEAGIDLRAFGAHSTRGAMASKAFTLGARLEDILNAADWSSDSTFKRFYFKPVIDMAHLVVSKL